VAAALLLAFPIRFWTKPVGRAMLELPPSPVERVNPDLGRTWQLLGAVAPRIPPGATFTVRAVNAEAEMEGFMLALGRIPHGRPLPSSYYGTPQPGANPGAEWVVVVGEAPAPGDGGEVVARFEHGMLLRRRPGR
jgi:hypothetical protein